MPYIDCKEIANKIFAETKETAQSLNPLVVALLSPDDEAGDIYLKKLQKLGKKVNVRISNYHMPNLPEELNGCIQSLNNTESVTGIMLISEPASFFESRTFISPLKNVEGNDFDDDVEKVFCTARACTRILQEVTNIECKEVVIVGYGKRVGKPLAYLLMRAHAGSVTTTHKYTLDLGSHLKRADIIISAVGKQNLIRRDMVKPGAFVIDAGISCIKGKIVGDVSPKVAKIARVTPVPGGVGPITCALLLKNAAIACQKQSKCA